MSGVARSHARCAETFLGDRCALASGHDARHQTGSNDRSITWGWADDPEYAHIHFDQALEIVDSNGNVQWSEVLGQEGDHAD